MSRRALTLTVASTLVLLLAVVGSVLPVPYVALMPGPTTDTLGANAKGEPYVKIEGRETFPDDGHLNFTTVTYRGGPENRIDLFTALRGWLQDDVAIVPEETIFPRNESQQQVDEENSRQMRDSQYNAEAAALHHLKIPTTTQVVVDAVQKGKPADGHLKPGDELLNLDGTKVTSVSEVTRRMGDRRPGSPAELEYRRQGKTEKVTLTTTPSDDGKRAVIGIVLTERHKLPFKIDISVGDVGGPSAGLMFSLAIIDKLDRASLTGGKFIAGTGTITAEGVVGPIGGIQQKMRAAADAGATVFLTPKDNCPAAAAARPDGLRLIRADTLDGTVGALRALAAGRTDLPACS
ncbi:YlbL family protein [Actinomadura flavalba]|uniref:YlbL family protein n=1 Tax=Actinomadura flavalba TaxID=1120938 RepID=UPI000363DA3D|nr:PDZ domain-containing protein [Actinomadura flavalba]